MNTNDVALEVDLNSLGHKLVDKGGTSDFTVAWPIEEATKCIPVIFSQSTNAPGINCQSIFNTLSIEAPATLALPDKSSITCRSEIVLCNSARHISATFRVSGNHRILEPQPNLLSFCGTHPSPEHHPDVSHPIGIDQTTSVLLSRLLNEPSIGNVTHPDGLVIFAGSTNSAKTKTAQSFILQLMSHFRHVGATPHLVTAEQPLEKWTAYCGDAVNPNVLSIDPVTCTRLGWRFTPRELGRDVKHLGQAVENALRQTPACFFIGEIRNDLDWNNALNIASTGHLVVTTTHAGSLSETLSRLLRALKTKTPADRGYLVRPLLAVVHLKPFRFEKSESAVDSSAVIPSIWMRTPRSISAMVSAGLSSVVPNGLDVIGRHQFLQMLLSFLPSDIKCAGILCTPLLPDCKAAVKTLLGDAFRSDLKDF
jgi:hypothetical protein